MKFFISLASLFLILNSAAYAQNQNSNAILDKFLRQKIETFKLKALTQLPKNSNTAQLELGQRLFMETELSGNRNISCMTCHHPRTGTSDLLPLSRTADGNGILRRNSPSLFNLGHQPFMFWDGRVHFDSRSKVFTTPEASLPVEVTNVMTSALSAQALFQMFSE